MSESLRVLIIDDSADDAKLVDRELRKAFTSVECRRTDSADSVKEALESRAWDIVILDYDLPGFGANEAIGIAQDCDPDLPIIIVSGVIDQEAAIAAMRAGVRDYLMKDDLTRLIPAVEREVEEAETHRRSRRAELALRSSEERFRTVVESSKSGIHVADVDGKILLANPALCDMFGHTREELEGTSLLAHIHPDDRETVAARRRARIRGDEPPSAYSVRLVRKDGQTIVVESVGSVLRYPDGRVETMSSHRDVTAEIEAQRRLRESEERFRAVFETARNGLVVFDERGRAELFNSALCEMLGYTQDEMQDMPLARVLLPEDRDQIYSRIAAWARGDAEPEQYELRLVRKDGQIVQAEISASRFVLEDGSARTLSEIRDVTEEKRLKEQLLWAQKSEALGTLVAGVAHDFNNLLTAIGGSIDLARTGPARTRWLDHADQSTQRAAELVAQLLQFARHDTPERTPLSLAGCVQQCVTIARETFDRRIDIVVEAEQSLPMVEADAGQLEQVLMNLLVNARDSVMERCEREEDGHDYRPRIEFRLNAEELDQPDDVEPQRRVLVSITDNGVGMAAEVRERIFDPFFTTKRTGEGTGLGLSTAYGIVAEHGGSLLVRSEAGQGATFTMTLPTTAAAAAHARQDEPRVLASARGTKGSVLLVDDEPVVLEFAEAALARHGYDVVAVSNGQDALGAVAERRFDLALVDVSMPPPDGWEVLARMQESAPEMTVLMASGYAIEREARERGAAGILEKPYRLRGLLRAVDENIGETAGSVA